MITFLTQIGRNSRIFYALLREGAFSLIDPKLVPPGWRGFLRLLRLIERSGPENESDRLAKAFARLGPSFVKAGQFLATRPDIVGIKAAQGLAALQDRMAPFAQDEAVGLFATALERSVEEVFSAFSEPIAAASIAQVHKGIIRDTGQVVAVKILRPGIRERFARDLDGMRFVARMAERFSAQARRLRLCGVVEVIARSVHQEMDLRLEAAALSELRDVLRDDPGMSAPLPHWDLTTRDVMVTQWVEGIPLSRPDTIRAAGHDGARLACNLLQGFLRQAIHHGYFHADMHQGNLFVDERGRLVLVDGGIMGRLGVKERRFLAEILYGFITRNYQRIAEVHFEAGYVAPGYKVEDFAQALRAVGEPIHDRQAQDIAMAKLLGLLFEITALFGMETRTELVMLQKTMVVVEGVARTLDPQLDMWRIAEPVVKIWLQKQLGLLGRAESASRFVMDLTRVATQIPAVLEQGLSQRPEGESASFTPLQTRMVLTCLAIIAASLSFIAIRLI
jgi:ubiquinone biosynthesis protein